MAATHRPVAALCAALLLCLAPAASAQQPSIDFTVSGTSTVRSWSCTAKGTVAITPGKGAAVPGFAKGVETATVTVPLKAFTCPNDEMQQHLLEHMKADQFPEIVYRLEKYEVTPGQIQAIGAMTITGVTQPLSFPVVLKAAPKGVEIEGNTRLEFKTFNLDPPVVFLGLLKVGPQIRIEFKGALAP